MSPAPGSSPDHVLTTFREDSMDLQLKGELAMGTGTSLRVDGGTVKSAF